MYFIDDYVLIFISNYLTFNDYVMIAEEQAWFEMEVL